jgi:hypothetical protein
MIGIIFATSSSVNKQVFYVGDIPIVSTKWIEYFSKELTGKSIRYVPEFFVYIISYFGTLLNKIKIPFPL